MNDKLPLAWSITQALVLAAAGALAVLLVGGLSLLPLLLSTLLIALGLILGFLAQSQTRRALSDMAANAERSLESQRLAQQASHLSGLDQLCGGVLPI